MSFPTLPIQHASKDLSNQQPLSSSAAIDTETAISCTEEQLPACNVLACPPFSCDNAKVPFSRWSTNAAHCQTGHRRSMQSCAVFRTEGPTALLARWFKNRRPGSVTEAISRPTPQPAAPFGRATRSRFFRRRAKVSPSIRRAHRARAGAQSAGFCAAGRRSEWGGRGRDSRAKTPRARSRPGDRYTSGASSVRVPSIRSGSLPVGHGPPRDKVASAMAPYARDGPESGAEKADCDSRNCCRSGRASFVRSRTLTRTWLVLGDLGFPCRSPGSHPM